ncbi:MAG: hypothetical protein ACI4II_03130 [Acutalibacteraceae bacterium]
MQRKSMLIKISTLLLACCLLLCGCTPTGITDNSSSIEPTEPPKPINMLTSYVGDDAPIITDIGDGKVLLIKHNFTNEDNEYKDTVVQIVDIINDTVCSERVFDNQLEPAMNSLQNGIWLVHGKDDLLYKLDDKLNTVKEISLPSRGGVFSENFKKYYYTQARLLYVFDVETEESTYIELPYELRLGLIYGFDSETNYLYGDFDACNEGYTAVMNIKDKSFRLFTNEINYYRGNGSTYYSSKYDEEAESFVYYKGTIDSDTLMCFKPNKDDMFSYNEIGSSGYLVGLKTEQNAGTDKGAKDYTRICRFTDTAIEYCDLDIMGFEDGLKNATYISGSNYLVGSSTTDSEHKLVVVDVNQLNFDNIMSVTDVKLKKLVDSDIWEENEKMYIIPEVSSELREAREYADEIEKKYSVTVLLSNQCLVPTKIESYCGDKFVTTDKQDFFDSEKERIMEALTVLDEALSQYPKDFFKHFKNDWGMGGMRYMLVGNINSISIDVAGYAENNGVWYNSVIDISFIGKSIYHHETWHNIEFLCTNYGQKCFEPENWDKLNPKGFEYCVDYYTENKEHDYDLYDPSTVTEFYFIDSYAMTNAWEDRARLFEYVMTPGVINVPVLSSSKAVAKFKVMTDAMCECWGEAAWETSQWEGALNDCGQ